MEWSEHFKENSKKIVTWFVWHEGKRFIQFALYVNDAAIAYAQQWFIFNGTHKTYLFGIIYGPRQVSVLPFKIFIMKTILWNSKKNENYYFYFIHTNSFTRMYSIADLFEGGTRLPVDLF